MAAKRATAAEAKQQGNGPEVGLPTSAGAAALPEPPGTIFIDKNSAAWKRKLQAQYPQFKSPEAQTRVLQRAKRAVYPHLMDLTQTAIVRADNGNQEAANFLVQLLGLPELPASVEKAPKKKAAAPEAELEGVKAATPAKTIDLNDPMKSVLSFYKKLGMTPPRLKPAQAGENQAKSEESISSSATEAGMEHSAALAQEGTGVLTVDAHL